MSLSAKTYTLTVVEKEIETCDTVTIKFKQPALKKVKYRAGQYITVIININGRKYRRPYSVSSVFGLDTTINITVKAIPNGVVSNYILKFLKVGDVIEVVEPMGQYILSEPEKYKSLFFWCAGSGITPNYSILRDVLFNYPSITRLSLIYSNKNSGSTIFGKELAALQRQFPERLNIYHIHTFPDELSIDTFYNSRIDADCIHKLVAGCATEGVSESAHYICGPQQMKELVISELDLRGTPASNRFSEEFHLVVDAAKLDKVVTADVRVEYGDQAFGFSVKKGTTILDACLDAGNDISYSCQSGTCTLCKAVLIEGEVQTETQHQPDVAMREDEILTCCSFPLTTKLKLKIP